MVEDKDLAATSFHRSGSRMPSETAKLEITWATNCPGVHVKDMSSCLVREIE